MPFHSNKRKLLTINRFISCETENDSQRKENLNNWNRNSDEKSEKWECKLVISNCLLKISTQ